MHTRDSTKEGMAPHRSSLSTILDHIAQNATTLLARKAGDIPVSSLRQAKQGQQRARAALQGTLHSV